MGRGKKNARKIAAQKSRGQTNMSFQLKDLYDDPLATAKTYALKIAGTADVREKRFSVYVEAGPLSYTETLRTTFNQLQVKAGTPVYATGQEDTAKGITGKSAIINTFWKDPPGENATRVYYLPWGIKSIYRVTPKAATGESLDGNLFFTGNLDGCMVSIMGTPKEPTIYHSNARGLKYDPDLSDFLENLEKIDRMHKGVATFASMPKKGQNQDEATRNPKHFSFLAYNQGSYQVQLSTVLIQNLSYGAVFGVRKQGLWTFFQQSYEVVARKEMDGGKWVRFSVNYARQLWP
jgi:hypothetical protein